MLNWDGIGVPPDAAVYEEKTDGQHVWFVCLTCNGRGADKAHCCSDGHKLKVRAHLERTIGRQAGTCQCLCGGVGDHSCQSNDGTSTAATLGPCEFVKSSLAAPSHSGFI